MYKDHKVAVVIPAYNEEKFVAQVISSVPSFVDCVVIVDDASQDATLENARRVNDSRVTVLASEVNRGVGGATIMGYRKALELECDVVVKADGDGQMPLERLAKLLDAIVDDGYFFAKGNRFLEQGSLARMPKLRLAGNMALTFLMKATSGYWHIFDPQNGFTAINAHALRTVNLHRVHQGYFFENDMLVHLNIHNFRIKDVPMPTIYGDEESKMRITSILFKFPVLLFRRFFYRIYQKYVLRDFSPIALFLGLGAFLMASGAVFGIIEWARGYITPGVVMAAVLPIILGFQLLLQALVLDINEIQR